MNHSSPIGHAFTGAAITIGEIRKRIGRFETQRGLRLALPARTMTSIARGIENLFTRLQRKAFRSLSGELRREKNKADENSRARHRSDSFPSVHEKPQL